MAKRNYLVEGLSGTGKSSVYEELISRGYKAVSTDRAWKYRPTPGPWMWNPLKAMSELERTEPDVLFVCGSSSNRDSFLPYFTKVFNLRIDDDTLRRRLQERTNNDYGKRSEELALMLTLNRSGEKPAGAIDVDATQPLHHVVDEVLRLADCGPVNVESTRPPWSKHASATGHSFVIDGAAIARLEYSWSGHVLTTLLPYLAERGIDLLRRREGSVFVFTPEDRERYLARLDPSDYDGAELRRYYEEQTETAGDGVEYAMLDAIAFLRDTLAPLEPGIVAVLLLDERSTERSASAAPAVDNRRNDDAFRATS